MPRSRRPTFSGSSKAASPSGRFRTTWYSSTRFRTPRPAKSRSSSCGTNSKGIAFRLREPRRMKANRIEPSARAVSMATYCLGVVPYPRHRRLPVPLKAVVKADWRQAMKLSKFSIGIVIGSSLLMSAGIAMAQAKAGAKPLAGETVKMVRIDALSGLMAPVGGNQLKSYQFFAEKFSANNPAGVKFEVTGIDNKLSPTESLNALKSAIDQGVRYIIQGNGSSVALALVDAVNKHNERNPGK